MRRRTSAAAPVVAALLLLAGPTPRASASPQQSRPTTRQESVVLIVTKGSGQGAQVEPVAVINNRGALVEPESNPAGGGALPSFLARLYRAGGRYRLIYGGAEAGTLTISAATPGECSPNAASADTGPTAAKLGGNVMALATDGAHAPRRQMSRRAPTDAERAAAFGVAKRFLAGKRLNASVVERGTTTLNLTATDLDGDGR
ncbi:MAG TPA: hypothetical protein VF621_17905, partial [Pyrinomonadaceae bacterium]